MKLRELRRCFMYRCHASRLSAILERLIPTNKLFCTFIDLVYEFMLAILELKEKLRWQGTTATHVHVTVVILCKMSGYVRLRFNNISCGPTGLSCMILEGREKRGQRHSLQQSYYYSKTVHYNAVTMYFNRQLLYPLPLPFWLLLNLSSVQLKHGHQCLALTVSTLSQTSLA